MARSDLLLQIIRAGLRSDQHLMRKSIEAIIAEERAKQHYVLAEQLSDALKVNGASTPLPVADGRVQSLFHEVVPHKTLDSLYLSQHVRKVCNQLIEEHLRADLLRSFNVEPRHRVMLVGPPGNGKTSLAEALANAISVPLIALRYEGVIGSYLGETASRLSRIFEYVRTRPCVFFLDEFDTLGKERGTEQETGEIKRVVSSLLLQIDSLPSYVVVITATNHPELLDRAVWRRFQIRLELQKPTPGEVKVWAEKLQGRIGGTSFTPSKISKILAGLSYAELEEFAGDIQRRRALSASKDNVKEILAECLAEWTAKFRPRNSK